MVDLHVGLKSNEPYTSIRTPDARIGVSVSGRYSCEFFSRSRWRFDAHSPGSICLHRNEHQSRYRFPVPEDSDFKWAMIYLPVGQLASAAEHLRRAGQPDNLPTFNSLVDRDPAIAHITVALLRAMTNGEGNLYAETVAAWLAVHLISRHGSGACIEDRNAGAISDARLSRVVEFMSAHFAEPLTLEQLAGEACISKYHFTRLFKSKVGQTPYQFLADLRMNAARQMLISTDLSVAQVGAACGYSTSPHFSAAFTAKFSMTPSEFRGSRLGIAEMDDPRADDSANQ
ncbi:AraC family transcriptional regulator [Bradyrhizobium yuanmingense]|uniref:AraC family transcriptional regulator n=1 Tax=Bradyrhizobium yuanmingense TaxID=108015 RepID=UPI0023B8E4D5|nr:AraC family transcriptional regulator [Bradyrhizobium yuanmingense]MDF0520150.1 AraC family transcriptional regulator [Bradyrhizobium yuanmingense]